MKKTVASLLALTFVFNAAATAHAAPKKPPKSAEDKIVLVPITEQLQAANAAFFDAIVKVDLVAYDKLVANNAVLTGSGDGEIATTLSFRETMQSPSAKINSIELSNLVIRPQGETAVVMGNAKADALFNGEKQNVDSKFMNVFSRRGGSWQLIVAYTESVEAEDAPTEATADEKTE
ncbi:MAG TPA: nuclear transport factor 2 family protein [Abditibacteriaceae bacterium]